MNGVTLDQYKGTEIEKGFIEKGGPGSGRRPGFGSGKAHIKTAQAMKAGSFDKHEIEFANVAKKLSPGHIDSIIHGGEYFRGENHSRAKVVLEQFSKDGKSELFKRMLRGEQKQIMIAVKRFKQTKSKK